MKLFHILDIAGTIIRLKSCGNMPFKTLFYFFTLWFLFVNNHT